MNVLDTAKRKQIVSALVEGNSIRATCRMTGAAKGTVLKLLVDLGTACRAYHDANVRGLTCKRVQCDEIWSFVGAKDKNVLPDEQRYGIGSIWTWTALDADTKLIAAYHVGTRDAGCAYEFMTDLASRIATRIQLTTDGHRAYINAVADAFGPGGVDYAMLVKLYGEVPAGAARYSPPACIGANLTPIAGDPDMAHVSTSHVERQNLTMRMSMRRFTRLTNGFSKKVENLEHAVAIHFMHYNFSRVHQTLRVTPAMAAGIADHVWEIDELIALMPKPVARAWGSVKLSKSA
ncbi:MAG TPA: IS1 family transposase [Polyangiaceae bacterium]|jgi:IS1 family transposase|nr:IS1 family transposase [Polyangiaceae bacterium]